MVIQDFFLHFSTFSKHRTIFYLEYPEQSASLKDGTFVVVAEVP
jgi:hypothetical protein